MRQQRGYASTSPNALERDARFGVRHRTGSWRRSGFGWLADGSELGYCMVGGGSGATLCEFFAPSGKRTAKLDDFNENWEPDPKRTPLVQKRIARYSVPRVPWGFARDLVLTLRASPGGNDNGIARLQVGAHVRNGGPDAFPIAMVVGRPAYADVSAKLPMYNLACALARLRDPGAAKALELGIARGGPEVVSKAKRDADFDGVRTEGWFEHGVKGQASGYPVTWCEHNADHMSAPSAGATLWSSFSQF